jgi:hypothetical protein
MRTLKNFVDEAASAMSAIYVMDAAVSMLAGGAIGGGKAGASKTVDQIIALAMAERARQVKRYQKASAAIAKHGGTP